MSPPKLRRLVQYMTRGVAAAKGQVSACTTCGCLVANEDQQRHRDYHLNNDK